MEERMLRVIHSGCLCVLYQRRNKRSRETATRCPVPYYKKTHYTDNKPVTQIMLHRLRENGRERRGDERLSLMGFLCL